MDSQVELIYQTVKQDITYQEIPNVQDPFGYDNDEDYKGGIPILEPVKCEPFDADVKVLDTGGDQMATLQPVNCFDYEGAADVMQADVMQANNLTTVGQDSLTIVPLSTTSSFEFGGETWQLVTTQQQVIPQIQQLSQVQQVTLPTLTQVQQVSLPQLQQVIMAQQSQTLTTLKSNFIETCEYITADSTISSDQLENDLSNQAYPVEVKQEHFTVSNGDGSSLGIQQYQLQETVLQNNNENSFSEDSVQNQVYESLGNLDGLALRYEVISNATITAPPTATVTPPAPKPQKTIREKVDPLGPMIREELEETGPAWYCRLCSYQTRDRRYIRKHVSRVHCKKEGAGPPKPKTPPPPVTPPMTVNAPTVVIARPATVQPDAASQTVAASSTTPAVAEPLPTAAPTTVKLEIQPPLPRPPKPAAPVQHICDICGWKARARYLLTNHFISKHQEGRPFPCELCSYKAKFKSSYLRHVQTIHEGLRPFSCQYCPYKATQKSCLERHVRAQHSQTKPYGCSFCPFRAITRSELEQHVDSKHDGRRPFTCYTCGFTTLLKRHLRDHMLRKHDGRRPYPCTFKNCTYRAVQKSSLDNHIKYKHLAVRPYACAHCQYTATSKSNLRAHIVSIHVRARKPAKPRGRKKDQAAGRPVLCECGLMCESRIQYAQHRGQVHGEEVLSCSVCPYMTTVASNLHKHTANKHLRSHGLLQGFRACAYCQFNSHSKRALRIHIKTVHKFL